jgi:UDP-N-acetylmuramate dehydrogenase
MPEGFHGMAGTGGSRDLNKFDIAKLLGNVPGSGVITTDESMAGHTSFRLGGPADVFVRPASVEGLSGILRECARNGIPL